MIWLTYILPDFVFHLIVIISIVGFVASEFFSFIPFVGKYAIPIKIIAAGGLAFGLYFSGVIVAKNDYEVKVLELQNKVFQLEKQSAELNTRLAEELLKKEQEIKDINNENRKRLKDLSDKLNKQCKVDQDIISIINNASKSKK